MITADCIRLRHHAGLALTQFLLLAVKSSVVREQIVRITRGVAQKKVSLSRFRSVAIPLAPFAEQARAATEADRLLSVADSALETTLREILRLQRLRQSILRWAFEGRLVEQSPTDEPASRLLERIRTERTLREATSVNARGRQKKTKARP